ncbi:rRNA-processing protein FCF2 [Nakaseomyces bracarensis]|uniref:rRNA-processing protein FCF2 n=1 Tax=Nakaseomyces bracarensis TaxID=273131 RepID=A0ABR4NLN8_9SACH
MDDIDELFGLLKQVSGTSRRSGVAHGGEQVDEHGGDESHWSNDVVSVEDDGVKEREKVFLGIEKELRALPKLETGFDQLAADKEKASLIDAGKSAMEKVAQKQKKDSKSSEWFTLPRPDDKTKREVQRDMLLIKHRAALDPKRHYKKDKWKVPERFSVGTIVEDKTEFYSSRLKNKERKSTMLETLMTDDTTDKYFKRKYSEIQDKKTSGKKAHYKKMKSMRHKR